jgi:hypothetical protein
VVRHASREFMIAFTQRGLVSNKFRPTENDSPAANAFPFSFAALITKGRGGSAKPPGLVRSPPGLAGSPHKGPNCGHNAPRSTFPALSGGKYTLSSARKVTSYARNRKVKLKTPD